MITLGKEVKDTISGFKGVAVARTVWLNDCVRIGVQPKVDKDGKYIEEVWIDEGQLVELEPAKKKVPKTQEYPGGPASIPKRHSDPQRRLEEKY